MSNMFMNIVESMVASAQFMNMCRIASARTAVHRMAKPGGQRNLAVLGVGVDDAPASPRSLNVLMKT